MKAAVLAISVVIMAMNWCSGIAAGIWLAVLGEWKIIGAGVIGILFGHWLIALALMPGLLLSAPAAAMLEKRRNFLAIALLIPSAIYTSIVIFGWCYAVFLAAYEHAEFGPAIPIMIWSYGVATAPWLYMASQEAKSDPGNESGAITVLFIAAGYILILFLRLVFHADILTCILTFATVLAAHLIYLIISTVFLMRTKNSIR